MKVGDVVMIYEDPISEKKPEGKAKLLELLMDGELQYWRVLFLSEDKRNPYNFNRWIKKSVNP